MDQRMKGGTPLLTDTLDATSVPEDFEQDQEKRKRVETEASDVGKEEDRRGKKREGDKGAVLELLIEGRCGGAGQQQLQICGRETSCPDGNVRLRIGVQAKRTKKPPKILESYVCKPTIRTYQRQQGRGGALPSRTATNPDDGSRDKRSSSDGTQTTCKQTASATSPSLSTPSAAAAAAQSLTPANATVSTIASATANPGTKQVPLKLAANTEVTPGGLSERGKKEKTPGIHEQPPPAVIKPCSSTSNQDASATLSRSCSKSLPGRETIKKHNGAVQSKKGLSNGGCSEDKLGDALSIKTAKHSSSISSVDAAPPGSSKTEICLLQKSNSPSVTAKSKSSPTLDMSSAQSQVQEASLKRSNDKKRDKERKVKKDKRKEKKPKGDGLENQGVKSDNRKEEIKKKKKDKGKDGKLRQGKEHKNSAEPKTGEKAEKSKTSLEKHRKEDTRSCGMGTFDNPYKVADQGRSDEGSMRDHIKQAELQPTTADSSQKSKENDIVKYSTVPPKHPVSSSAPPPLSPPSSCQEQDSRPLKKRKARRPSWTKLVHRAQRVENHEADPQQSFSQKLPTHSSPSCSPTSSTAKPLSPKQNPTVSDPKETAAKSPTTSTRKRVRPKSRTMIFNESPLRLSPEEVAFLECDDIQKSPVLDPSPKKRGRPRKQPLNTTDVTDKNRNPPPLPPDKGNRQLKIRRLINEMKKRKKKKLHKVMTSDNAVKESKNVKDVANPQRTYKKIAPLTVPTLSDLSSSFGTKLGPQINVSKKGTIYMGKRRGRKPKSQMIRQNSHSYTQSSLFSQPTETSLFMSNQSQPPAAHPFPSPSLTHSSGAQSPYSEGSVAEPTSTLLFPPPFSLPSPSSSCTSPRPTSNSSLSPFVKKSCPCQGRQHFPFHQSSCKLSSPSAPLHPTSNSPGHLKDATPSPRSEAHSEETLPSDSGIGTDNSVCERREMRGVRGMLRLGQGSGGILGGPKRSSLADPLMTRHKNPIGNSTSMERHRHRHRRRDYSCPASCNCLCPCSGHNKCTHPDYFPCIGHSALKRQKNKHKKKHQQLLMQDPEFLSELEELIGQFSEVHIGRRGWARSEVGQAFDGSRRHHSSHSHRSNIFRINLNGFYSPHPTPYAANPSFSPQSFYPCQTLHCNRKPERRQCGCPSKFQETIDNMGFYSSYPPATTLYHHLPGSYPLPSPHQYASQQPHHAHILLNPARFHRRRSRLLREGALGGEIEGNGGGLNLGYPSSLSCDCGHKHKHRQRLCERNVEEDAALEHEEQEDMVARETFSTTKSRFILGQGGGRKGTRGIGGLLSKESPWLRENANHSFSAATSSSLLAERSKHASLFSVGLGSSHLSSFGGGWGGLGQSWTKLRGAGFPNNSWGSSAGRARPMIPSDLEDDDRDDVHHLSRTSPSPTHTNLFTSVDVATGGRGLRSGSASRNLGSGDRSWRTNEPAWTERREAALQGDPRSRGQLKGVPKTHSDDVKNKRRPGRPRKRPLPSTLPPPLPSPDLLRGCSRNNGDAGARRALSDCDGADVSSVQQVTDLEPQAKRKRGRKRKHDASPCHQSTVC
ncbi:uncharacterized protein LOC144057972 isoform X2 [Vanacampus margaritifer]